MLLLKLLYHTNCYFIKILLRFTTIIGKGKIAFGNGTTFRRGFSAMVDKGAEIRIGNDCFFNNYCSLNANKKIEIGEGSIFGENVKIYDHNHLYRDKMLTIKEQGYASAPVKIGKHCWIASNVVILKGVTIGDHCIIGAGCIVYKNVASNTVLINHQALEELNF